MTAWLIVLTGRGWTLAQPIGPASEPILVRHDADVPARQFGFWGSAESLFWWTRNGVIPPLATVGGSDGVPGSPGVRVLVDSLDFDDSSRPGGRFTLGYRFESIPALGVEAISFFLADGHSDITLASSGTPVLAQPFLNTITLGLDANRVAAPGVASGTVTIGARTSLWGAEANLTNRLTDGDCESFHLTVLGGFRFLSLEDEVTSTEQFQVAPSVPGFGGNRVGLHDQFRTANRFYGGQVGLEAGVTLARLTIDVRGKLALAPVHQTADVVGTTNVVGPTGSTTMFQGGLYALRSNIGHYQGDQLAFLPELDVTVGLPLTRHLRLFAGYSLLWVSTVARAGEQIDPVINASQFPIRSGNGAQIGPARPAFRFETTDFWAQGVNFGLELRY